MGNDEFLFLFFSIFYFFRYHFFEHSPAAIPGDIQISYFYCPFSIPYPDAVSFFLRLLLHSCIWS